MSLVYGTIMNRDRMHHKTSTTHSQSLSRFNSICECTDQFARYIGIFMASGTVLPAAVGPPIHPFVCPAAWTLTMTNGAGLGVYIGKVTGQDIVDDDDDVAAAATY